MSEAILSIRDLAVSFAGASGNRAVAVSGLSLDLFPGTVSALVGESGSGKSVSAMSVLGLLPSPPCIVERGQVLYRDRNGAASDLLTRSPAAMRRFRGGEIAMIFQEPMTSLNPVIRIGVQIVEAIRLHRDIPKREAIGLAHGLLERVGIEDSARRFRQYPHEFSGGMRQRVMIAIALACRPRVLIADEPTTALDVTIQASILELIRTLADEEGLSVLLITHDLALVRAYADRVAVMFRGHLLEEGPCGVVQDVPAHPYTRGLLGTVPDLGDIRDRLPVLGELGEGDSPRVRVNGEDWRPWIPGGGQLGGRGSKPVLIRVADGHVLLAVRV